ncbi:MAG: hypothetical protein J7M25_00570 [Deltaproteobacteria bacterium]|nr:hypothetical protein [Deltaproteobacteria bacterium]
MPKNRIMMALVLVAVAAGCAGGYGKKDKLLFALDRFNNQVRWGRQEQVATFFVPGLRNRYLKLVESKGEGLHISTVHFLRSDVSRKMTRAVVRYRFRWHNSSDIYVHKTIIVEHWHWVKGAWVLSKLEKASGPDVPILPTGKLGMDKPNRDGGSATSGSTDQE